MDITDYTTLDDVRALLGVSSDEIEDATLSLSVYSTGLEADLRDVSSSLMSTYQTVRAIPEGTRTDNQDWLYRMCRQFSAYAVARHLSASLPLFSPKEITDSKATLVRYSSNPYEDTIRMVENQFQTARARLEAALAAVLSTTVSATSYDFPFMTVVTPSPDPVTGN